MCKGSDGIESVCGCIPSAELLVRERHDQVFVIIEILIPSTFLSSVIVSLLYLQDVDLDDASSSCSSLSARTQGSVMSVGAASTGSYRSRTLPRLPSSKGVVTGSSGGGGGGGGGGGVDEESFQKAFLDVPSVTVSPHLPSLSCLSCPSRRQCV